MERSECHCYFKTMDPDAWTPPQLLFLIAVALVMVVFAAGELLEDRAIRWLWPDTARRARRRLLRSLTGRGSYVGNGTRSTPSKRASRI
jgi:hypothetical protein